MSSDVAVRIRGLSKIFPIYDKPMHRLAQMILPRTGRAWHREFTALRDIDLDIHRGETVGIVGRNGSGKSTLLQLICGTLTPTTGSVDVRGRVAALLELGAGFNPEFTGRENVYLNGAVLGLSRAEIDARFDAITDFADIGDFISQPVKSYSSGMYVRLAFAVAINVDPEILVVDEALAVGDEAFQRKCFARIDQIRDAGATVLFVSHSAGMVVDLCDRAVLLDQGELLAQAPPKRVISLYQKLLYAPQERVESLRAQIRSGELSEALSSGTEASADAGIPIDHARAPDAAYWIEGLVPTSTVAYEGRGAHIHDARIEKPGGGPVNVLSTGHDYDYVYRVRFDASLDAVRFGMMIRSLTGMDIGGAATSASPAARIDARAGDEMEVRFRFRCLLTQGTYFLNAGVLASFAAGEEYAARCLDIAMFRVLPESSGVATGLVDFGIQPSVVVSP